MHAASMNDNQGSAPPRFCPIGRAFATVKPRAVWNPVELPRAPESGACPDLPQGVPACQTRYKIDKVWSARCKERLRRNVAG
jgi:hypothetical protein